MTEKEKRTILDMRAAGKQYKEISKKLGIEVSALKVFVQRQKKPSARKCAKWEKRLSEASRAKQRFCSTKCKNTWWKKFPNQDGNFDNFLIVLRIRKCYIAAQLLFLIPALLLEHGHRP